jgi:3',5'-cyclic AMP phosphodiesterase CpdA
MSQRSRFHSLTLSTLACLLAAQGAAQIPPSGPPSRPLPEPSTPPWQAATLWPDRIVVTLERDPKSSFSVTWRTQASVTTTRAEIVRAADHSRFDIGAVSVPARTEVVDLTTKIIDGETHRLRWNNYLEQPAYHSVTFADLEADTVYAYRVMGAEDHWSEWFQTRTAPAGEEAFKFLYFGDAQNAILSHWARVARAAFAAAPDARFAVHAGDLVNFGSRDFEWAEWFEAVGFIHGMIPALPAVGNHEYYDGIARPEGGQVLGLSVLWRPQFTLPQDPALPDALRETVYSVHYADTLIVVLDTQADRHFEAQAAWLDATLAASTEKWTIVTMHHPMFELVPRNVPGLPDTGPARRALFLPIFARHGVDIALQGHDHTYGRGATYAARGPSSATFDDVGTVFVTSSSGQKMYPLAPERWDLFTEQGAVLRRTAENTPFFQVISIDGDALHYEARTATGLLYDAFRIDKSNRGQNTVTELPTDFESERHFDNTGPYEDGQFDRIPVLPNDDRG